MIRTLRVLRYSAICARPLMPSGARPLSNSFVPSTAAKMGRAGVRTVFPVANRLAAGGLALGVAGGVVAGAMLEEVLDDDLL